MNARKNILIVASSLHIGGAERVVANLAKYLNRDRFNVTVCHLLERGVIGDELQQQGIPVIGIQRHGDRIRRYFSFLGLRRAIKELEIDLLHSHTTYSLADSCLSSMTLPGVRTVHTFHRGNYPNYDRHYMLMEYAFSRICDRLVAVGVEQGKTIRDAYRLSEERVQIILNGVEESPKTGNNEWEARIRADGRIVIGSISTLIEQKGITYLIDTVQSLRDRGVDALFVVVGEGGLRPQLEEKSRQLGLSDSIIFTGWVPNAASRMMPLFDIFFQPSLWEAMSMVVLEAMAAGKPVVVTEAGDNRHVVVHEETGLVVQPRDVDQMARALQELSCSKETRDRYGKAGRQRFEMDYTARVMTQKYEKIYSDLLD